MLITVISDLHGHYPQLPGGDLLIVAGDLMGHPSIDEWCRCSNWLNKQDYGKIVFIAGNHDTMIEEWDKQQDSEGYNGPVSDPNERIEYLSDSGTEFEGFKIWGSPWTAQFPGINPLCCAFTVNFGCDTEYWLEDYWKLIPNDIDILITHSPPFGVFDRVKKYNSRGNWNPKTDGYEAVGSKSLREHVMQRIKPKLHVFGHIHEWGGQILDTNVTKFVNASHVNEDYEPVNSSITVEI